MNLPAPGAAPRPSSSAPITIDGLPSSIPLVVLALGLPMIMVVTLFTAIARDVPGEREVLSFFLGSSGAAAAATVGMVAGLVVLRRPASSLSSVGSILLGGAAGLIALGTITGTVNFDLGIEATFDRLVSSAIGPAGSLLVMAAVAVLVGLNAQTPGDSSPTIPVLGLTASAVLVGLNGIVQEVLGLTFTGDGLSRLASILSSFSLEPALLVLVAAILLTLQRGPNRLWPLVACVAGGILAAICLSSLVALLADDGRFVRLVEDPSRAAAAVALAAIALALAVMSGPIGDDTERTVTT